MQPQDPKVPVPVRVCPVTLQEPPQSSRMLCMGKLRHGGNEMVSRIPGRDS